MGNIYKFGHAFSFRYTVHEIVKLKKKFNVTIPKSIRKKISVRVGQLMEVGLEDEKIILKPISGDPAERLQELIGSLKAEQIKKQAEKLILKESKSSLAKKLEKR